MKEVIDTKVRSGRNSAAIWLDGGKLARNDWDKGDTVEIERISDSSFALVRSDKKLPRSTRTTHNFSGKKKPSRSDILPVLDLPISKAGVVWDLDTCLKVLVTPDRIVVSINDYAEQRRQRVSKLKNALETQEAAMLEIEVSEAPDAPAHNETAQADICRLTFDPSAPKSARFFNAMMSIEKSNPFAIEVEGFDAAQNVMQDGLISVLNSLKYTTLAFADKFLAVSDDLELDTKALAEREEMTIEQLVGNAKISQLKPAFGKALACKESRAKVLAQDMENGQLTSCSLFHGGGTIEYANSQLLAENDLDLRLRLVSEIEDDYLQHSYEVNRYAFDRDTLILSGDMTNFDPSNGNVHTSLFTAGISCKGASRSGRSALKLKNAECHPTAGHLFWSTLKFAAYVNPAIVVIENTDSYASTASFDAIKYVLEALEYGMDYGVIDAHNYGSTETRKRLFLIACDNDTALTNESAFTQQDWFVGPRRPVKHFIDQSIPDDHDSYREYTHLKEKAKRDAAKGNGFAPALYSGDETRTLLIRQSYTKAGSTDPFYRSPINPELWRLFSPIEHAPLKGYPTEYVTKGGSNAATLLHSVLGQGWTWNIVNKIMGHVIRIAKQAIMPLGESVVRREPVSPQVHFKPVSAIMGDQMDLFAA